MLESKHLTRPNESEAQMSLAKQKEIKAEGTSFMSTKLFKRRWFILFLFSFYSGSNAFQWIQYSIIGNIISKYDLILVA